MSTLTMKSPVLFDATRAFDIKEDWIEEGGGLSFPSALLYSTESRVSIKKVP